MKARLVSTALIVLSSSLISAYAFACGESLYRIGKGVAYRDYIAPLPGAILVVVRTDSEQEMANRLSAAGHDVHVVNDPRQLAAELERGKYDLVLALYSDRITVESQMAAANAQSTYLPVARSGSDEVNAARKSFAQSLSTDDSVKEFLRAIHHLLKEAHV
jgi:hypothetical protein